MNLKSTLLSGLLATCLVGPALATEGIVGPVQIRSLSVVGWPFGGHLAGNVEITVQGALPFGLACDPTYITTKKANDPDRALLAMLMDAKLQKRAVKLRVTDDPTRQAYSGRCSVLAVEFPWPNPVQIAPPAIGPVECNTKLCNQ